MNKIIFLIFSCALFHYTSAQDKNNLIEKIVDIKAQKFIDKFQLTGNTAEEFRTLLKAHTYTTFRLIKKRRQIFNQIKNNYESGEGLDVLLDKFIETEDSLYTVRKNFINDIRNLLDSKQTARIIVDEKKFDAELRQMIRDIRKKRNEKRLKE